MITTLSAIQVSITKAVIIAALVLLNACTAVRVGYNNGQQLSWWWLDGYVDFSSEQAPQAKAAIDRWFDWHRPTQLPEYAAVLASAQTQLLEPTTAAAACRWQTVVRDKLEPAIDRALLHLADLLPGLREAQWKHIEQRYAKSLDEMRGDYLQPDLAKRRQASIKRATDRAEQIYGSLEEPQRRVIAAGVAASPFDPQLWMLERKARQRDNLDTLRRLANERADTDQRVAALRALAERIERSPDPAYRAYQQRLMEFNCALAAQLHNSTSPAQRQKAKDKFKGWEEDLRALSSSLPG
jgi:hypothetical protein